MSWKLIACIGLLRFIIRFIHVVRLEDLDRWLIICHLDLVDVVVGLVLVHDVGNVLGLSLSCELKLLLAVLAVVKVLNVVGLDVIVGLVVLGIKFGVIVGVGLLTCRRMAVSSLPKSKNRILLLRRHVLILLVDWQDVVARFG